MKSRHLTLLKRNLFKPCKKILKLFKFKLRRPHSNHRERDRPSWSSKFRSLKETRETDQVTEFTSFSDSTLHHHKEPHPSPLTPAYVRMDGRAKIEGSDHCDADISNACRSFERYLMEMVIEEGKMRDLVDVEELLYCWKNLRSPVFVDLVCRFYGEVCKDVFSRSCEDGVQTPNKRFMK